MVIHTIYLISNDINDKVYIGYTSMTVEQRWAFHVKDSARSRGSHLHHAIVCYGASHFKAEAIYQSLDKDHTHNVMEAHFIKEYDSITNGYNLQPGGEGGTGKPIKVYQYSRTLELIKVWDSAKEAAASINVSPAAIATALRNADKGKASALKGFVWTRQGISPSLKKGSMLIEQLTRDGDRVAIHHSTISAAKTVSGTSSGITQGLRNPHQAWYGFYWRPFTSQ